MSLSREEPVSDQVIIVTGASSGIGAAAARRLARDGARLALVARRADRLREVGSEVERLGAEALLVPADVTQGPDVRHMVEATLARWGRVDVLVNNAGISFDEPITGLEAEKLRQEVNVNLIAPIECSQAVLPVMLRQRSGHIINVASIEALIATPGSSVYCATKFGLLGYSDSIRRRLRGTGVHVSTFCPGYVVSELNPRLKAHVEGRADAPPIRGLMPAEHAGDAIAGLIRRPRRLVVIPESWRPLVLAGVLFPWLADALVTRYKAKRN
jgi:short-subunit dehydrogenase